MRRCYNWFRHGWRGTINKGDCYYRSDSNGRSRTLKAQKHIRITMLAESKINTISDHISKALKDNHVSDDEFALIMSELTEFYQMKDEIRTKTKTKIDDETKQSLIRQGKEQAVEQFKNMFGRAH
jgi:dsDNA-specific endonuclease/ATPase MutS2